MTYFAHVTAAERYAAGRPYFHPLVVEMIRRCCGIETCDSALDVGCGTGQSTVPLTALARQVTGIDVSQAMLDQARRHPAVQYVQGQAEALPFAAEAFDLLTVGLAFHWLERERFLREAQRVLRPGGWLVLYNDWCCGSMKENADFAAWFREGYLRRYPSPPRNSRPIGDAEVEGMGFGPLVRERFGHEEVMSPEQLVAYLLTQSNVIAAVEQGGETVAGVGKWLMGEVKGLFTGDAATFGFAGVLEACHKG